MSLIIEDITFKEYFTLEAKGKEAYDFAMKYANIFTDPVDVFGLKDLTEQSFGFVKDLQQDVADGLQWDKLLKYITILTGKSEKVIVNYRLLTISRFITYLLKEVERVNEVENQLLGHTPDSAEVEAGINNFAKFGHYPQLRKLAGEDVTKIEEIKKIKYDLCLLELYYQKENMDFLQRHHDIKSRK